MVRQADKKHDFSVVLDALRQGSYTPLHVALAHGFTVEDAYTRGALPGKRLGKGYIEKEVGYNRI